MKLLLDENLSPRLAAALEDLYPGSLHVSDCGLDAAADNDIWAYAQDHGFNIVTKDSDFYQRSIVHGAPPKVVWLQLGNCTTTQIEDVLRRFVDRLNEFCLQSAETCLAVTRTYAISC